MLQDLIERCVATTGRCRIALSGGSTPAGTYTALAQALPPAIAERLLFTFVDERLPKHPQPVDHADSNLRLAQTAWFAHATAPPKFVLPMGSLDAPAQQLATFVATFELAFESALDLALLGVGPDGHIGSLFPGHLTNLAASAPVLVDNSPKPPPLRMSLDLQTLAAARHVVLLAKGASKAEILARARLGDTTLPLGRLHPKGSYTWILDPAAAANLNQGVDNER